MKILVVDDSIHVINQLKFFLSQGGYSDLLFAQNVFDAFKHLKVNGQSEGNSLDISLILMDIVMPEIDGIEACKRIKALEGFEDIPIIMVTAEKRVEGLQAAFDAGAVDYITKPINRVELLARVRSILKLKKEMDDRKAREKDLIELNNVLNETNFKLAQANKILQHLSVTDALTGIPNRRHFSEALEFEWQRLKREKQPISVIMADIDYFKQYNDRYGHPQGDVCLCKVARALDNSLKRSSDIVARYGGEEFVGLLPNTDIKGAVSVAEEMQRKLNILGIEHEKSKVSNIVTISLGISSVIPSDNFSPEELLILADQALYNAKTNGRNQYNVAISGPNHIKEKQA